MSSYHKIFISLSILLNLIIYYIPFHHLLFFIKPYHLLIQPNSLLLSISSYKLHLEINFMYVSNRNLAASNDHIYQLFHLFFLTSFTSSLIYSFLQALPIGEQDRKQSHISFILPWAFFSFFHNHLWTPSLIILAVLLFQLRKS